MSPVNYTKIKDKLFKLQESTRIIEELISEGEEKIIKDAKLKSALFFNLMISLEIILDIGNHILAEQFNDPASSYRDVIIKLGKKEVVPSEFSKENESMGDFRNKLVHDYDMIEERKTFKYAGEAPEIFKKFAKYFTEFLNKQN